MDDLTQPEPHKNSPDLGQNFLTRSHHYLIQQLTLLFKDNNFLTRLLWSNGHGTWLWVRIPAVTFDPRLPQQSNQNITNQMKKSMTFMSDFAINFNLQFLKIKSYLENHWRFHGHIQFARLS